MDFIFRRSYRSGVKAVVFDWTGTIVDFGSMAPAITLIELFKKHDIQITMTEARGPMGSNARDHIRRITQIDRVAKAWKSVHDKDCTEEDIDAIYADFIPIQIDKISEYANLIPGTLDVMKELRKRGIKIGTVTGYNRDIVDALITEAKKQGFKPDISICSDDVAMSRPHPWMAVKCVMEMGIYPFEACAKFGDTIPDIQEGLNAGMWSVGLVMAGNEIGMNEEELRNKDPKRIGQKRKTAYQKMAQAGAHFIGDTIADVPDILDQIDDCLARCEKP